MGDMPVKRFITCLFVLILLSCMSCSALETDFYCEFTPKTATGSVFYIDIYSRGNISAAVFELSYDSAMVSFDSVSAISKSSSVSSKSYNGFVRAAIADSKAIYGHICRAAFKATSSGSCDFTLRVTQAADESLNHISAPEAYTLSVSLGKTAAVSSSAVKSEKDKQSSSSSSKKQSYIGTESKEKPEDIVNNNITTADVRKRDTITYLVVGAGSVVLVGLLIFFGILIGKKLSENSKNNKTIQDPESIPEQETTGSDQ